MDNVNRLIAVGALLVGLLAEASQVLYAQPDGDFQKAYERWQTALESEPALWSNPFFVNDRVGSPERQDAVKAVLLYGPAGVPGLVESIRHETSRTRLYCSFALLEELAGIAVFWKYTGNAMDEAFEIRDWFVQEWDSGIYRQPEKALANAASRFLREEPSGRPISARDLVIIRQFGIYAMPFIANAIKTCNSPEM
jgi:hypothetical protein